MLHRQKSNTGLALVQALLLSIVISILLISMVSLTQQQQRQTIELIDSARVDLELYSAAQKLQFDLLTNYWGQSDQLLARKHFLKNWNFFGESFERYGARLKIINLRSLISVRGDQNILGRFIYRTNPRTIDKQQAKDFAAEIIEWQQPPTTVDANTTAPNVLPLQHPIEMSLLIGQSKTFMMNIFPYIQPYTTSAANPVYMPQSLAKILYGSNTAAKIKKAQDTGQLSTVDFNRITGFELDEIVGYSPGPEFRLAVYPSAGKGRLLEGANADQKRYYAPLVLDVGVYPYADTPIKTFLMSRAVSSYLLWETSVDE